MHVYLVQHGKAKTTEEDPTRGLSDEGREDLEHIANFLAGLRVVCLEKEQNGTWSVVWAVVPGLLLAQPRLAA